LLQKINIFLKTPLNTIPNIKSKVVICIALGFLVYLFLLAFKPFQTENLIKNYHLFFIGFPVIVAFTFLFYLTLFQKIAPKYYQPNMWTIGKQILFTIQVVLTISLINYLYNISFGKYIYRQYSFIEFIGISTAVALLPTFILLFAIYIFFNDKEEIKQKIIQSNKKLISQPLKVIKLISNDINTKDLIISKDDFLYIKAENNYCKVCFLKDKILNTQLIRLTLNQAQEQLTDIKFVFRCHRSFIINLNQIHKAKGNSKELKIYLNFCNQVIPVSRKSYFRMKKYVDKS
jgi:DNA-binding LytR/AlgR family response regulator